MALTDNSTPLTPAQETARLIKAACRRSHQANKEALDTIYRLFWLQGADRQAVLDTLDSVEEGDAAKLFVSGSLMRQLILLQEPDFFTPPKEQYLPLQTPVFTTAGFGNYGTTTLLPPP